MSLQYRAMSIQPKEKFFYASGAVANGVKGDAFTFFLLFFYSNVIGLTPGLASLAIFIALMVDALTDPIMGVISDRTNHRLAEASLFPFGNNSYGTVLLHALFHPIILGFITTTIIFLDAYIYYFDKIGNDCI